MPRDVAYCKVHGFNDPTLGEGNIDKDSDLIEIEGARLGLNIKVACDENTDYGDLGLFKVHNARYEPVARLVNWIEGELAASNTVVLEGYSNGWNFILQALEIVSAAGIDLWDDQKIILIGVHPAGRVKPQIPPEVTAVWWWITRSDWAVRFATYASLLKLVPGWGRAGYIGYRGNDPRFRRPDLDLSNIAKGHGGAYHDHNLEWGAREKVKWVASICGI